MLFRILKLFGIDIPARIAEVRVDLEERFDLAKGSVQQAAQTAAVLATLFFLASFAALAAFAVSLIALYGCLWTCGRRRRAALDCNYHVRYRGPQSEFLAR
jgi:hypothetical protein